MQGKLTCLPPPTPLCGSVSPSVSTVLGSFLLLAGVTPSLLPPPCSSQGRALLLTSSSSLAHEHCHPLGPSSPALDSETKHWGSHIARGEPNFSLPWDHPPTHPPEELLCLRLCLLLLLLLCSSLFPSLSLPPPYLQPPFFPPPSFPSSFCFCFEAKPGIEPVLAACKSNTPTCSDSR